MWCIVLCDRIFEIFTIEKTIFYEDSLMTWNSLVFFRPGGLFSLARRLLFPVPRWIYLACSFYGYVATFSGLKATFFVSDLNVHYITIFYQIFTPR